MVMSAQPRPWTTTAGREIADAEGNVVQYSVQNLGQICLTVNSYDRMFGALAALDSWFAADPASRTSENEMRIALRLAMGRIGCEQLASMIEALTEASPDIDRRISSELSIPEAAYTSSSDAAMTLVPKGWRMSVGDKEQLDIATNEVVTVYSIEIKSPAGAIVTGINAGYARALSAAAMRAQDLARG